jgi:hypothetical protein
MAPRLTIRRANFAHPESVVYYGREGPISLYISGINPHKAPEIRHLTRAARMLSHVLTCRKFGRARVHFSVTLSRFCPWLGILPRGAHRAAPFIPRMPGAMAHQDLFFMGLRPENWCFVGGAARTTPRQASKEHYPIPVSPEGSVPRRECGHQGLAPPQYPPGSLATPSVQKIFVRKGRKVFEEEAHPPWREVPCARRW